MSIDLGKMQPSTPPRPGLRRIISKRRNGIALGMCCLFVAAVSVHDAMLVVLNASVIGEVERNPVGRWLIKLHGGEVWLFVSLKFLGTAIACAALVSLYEFRTRLALTASTGVAAFQLWLLWHLTFAI